MTVWRWKKEGLLAFLWDTAFDVLGSILFAAGIVVFAEPAAFAPGGITGITLIIRHKKE